MEYAKVMKCPNCSANLDTSAAENGVVRCKYCKQVVTLPKIADEKTVLQLEIGRNHLYSSNFDDAYTIFSEVAQKCPDEPEAYMGMAFAAAKIQFIHDKIKDRLQPICHDISANKFTDNRNYQKALALAKDQPERLAEYKALGSEIDYIMQSFYQLHKDGVNYDTFICVKVSEEGDSSRHTEDSHTADDLYHELSAKGYKPFYSEREIRGRVGADYEALILYALHVSKSMLIVCSDESYLRTPWVANEYTRFLELMGNDEKLQGSLAVVFKNKPIESIPGLRGKIQGICSSNPDAYLRIFEFVEKYKLAGEAVPQIKRKEYEKVTYEKKKVVQTGVEKRTFANMGQQTEISVSDGARLKLAKEFLQKREFTQARRYIDMVLQNNKGSSDAYWTAFLIDCGCASTKELEESYKVVDDWSVFEKAVACASSDEQKAMYYGYLTKRVKNKHDWSAFQEYFAMPDSDEAVCADLVGGMCEYALSKGDSQIFDNVIKYVSDTATYIDMNLRFARKMCDLKYYKAILDIDAGHQESLWAIFDAQFANSDKRYQFCSQKENFAEVEKQLFAYGFNNMAFKNLLLELPETKDSETLCQYADFLLSLVPYDALYMDSCKFLVYKALVEKNVQVAKYYNSRILSEDKLNYESHYIACMLSYGTTDPMDLRGKKDVFENPDYFAAIDSYTEKNPSSDNIFLKLAEADSGKYLTLLQNVGGRISSLDTYLKRLYDVAMQFEYARKKQIDKLAGKAYETAQRKARTKRKVKTGIVASIYGAIGLAALVYAVIMFMQIVTYDGVRNFNLLTVDADRVFLRVMPLMFVGVTFVYMMAARIKRVRFWRSMAYGLTTGGIAFVTLCLAFLAFMLTDKALFRYTGVQRSYGKSVYSLLDIPDWSIIVMFVAGCIILANLIMALVSEHKDGTFIPDDLFDYNPNIWWVIVSILACSVLMFAAAFGIKVRTGDIALDPIYFANFVISCLFFALEFPLMGFLAGYNDRLHESYFVICNIFNSARLGVFVWLSMTSMIL